MRESSTYQGILEEGRVEGERNALQETLLSQGRQKFGSISEAVQAQVLAIRNRRRLKRMTNRLLVAADWQELLSTP